MRLPKPAVVAVSVVVGGLVVYTIAASVFLWLARRPGGLQIGNRIIWSP